MQDGNIALLCIDAQAVYSAIVLTACGLGGSPEAIGEPDGDGGGQCEIALPRRHQ